MAKLNIERVKAMFKAEKSRGNRAVYDGDPTYGSPEYAVAKRFDITCRQVRDIVGKRQPEDVHPVFRRVAEDARPYVHGR